MADAFTQVPPDSTGDKIDTEELTVGANTVNRQRVQIAGAAATDIAPVDSTAGVKVDLGADNDVTIGAALPAGTNNIGDVDIASALPAGTNNIGDVDIASALPAGTNNIGDVDIASAIPAGANKIGQVGVNVVDVWDDAASAEATIKFASVDVASSGDNTIVSSVASKRIVVLNYVLVASAANTVQWKSATAGAITGGMQLAANGGVSAESQFGMFATTAGEALVLNLSAASSVDGHITYVELD